MKIASTPTPQGTERVLEVAGAKIPLPKWGPTMLALLVLVAAVVAGSLYGYVWFRDHEKHDGKIMQRVADAEFTQLEESQKHFSEPAEVSVPIYQDARGLLKVSLYRSDSCILIERHAADLTKPVVNQFILDPARIAAQPAPKFAQHRLMSIEGVAWAQQPMRCIPPQNHPGKVVQWTGDRSADGCWVTVWRRWEDTCTGYTAYNGCANVWSPNWTWTYCTGH